ncbi:MULTISPECIES: O-unit flippase-like protein [unclassified Clostridium]|uniref:O-unit flippase-like protein n=1 Tax=unclassified Clostridium TaxID=2614128 RepID=UPI00029782B9|nr:MULTISPECIES: O-unit flippase-like protein [unclassified Clostridium]EKQ56965.1 MAG: membrane protein involved in the export of O-antigen and teichoic acid [Clostridium sp. Maddingley MBC34-26]
MKITVTKRGLIWSYIGTIMSMTANILMLPFIIYYLDADMLGLWYVFTSIGAIATLFDFGFAVTFARNITYCWSGAEELRKENVVFVEEREPNFQVMKRVLYTCRYIYLILSLFALLLLLTIGTSYICYISRGIIGYKHIIAWVIYSIAAFLNLYYGYYASFLRGVGAIDLANKNTVIARAAQIIVTIVFLAAGAGIIGASAAYLVYGTLFRVLGKFRFYQYHGIGERLKQINEKHDKQQVKDLFFVVWHNAWRDGSISIFNYFCNQVSVLICSVYLSLSETGVYSIGVQIASAIAAIAATLYTAYQPGLQEAYINNNRKKLKSFMSIIVTVFIGIFIFGVLGTVFVGLPLLRLVKPETIVTVPVLLGLCVYQFMLTFRNCYTSYFSCTNRIPYVKAFMVSAILCVVFSFIFIGPLNSGIYGLIIAQILSQALYNIWAWPIKAHKELELSFSEMIHIGVEEICISMKRFLKGRKYN